MDNPETLATNTHDKDKQSTKTQHRKIKKINNTDPIKKTGDKPIYTGSLEVTSVFSIFLAAHYQLLTCYFDVKRFIDMDCFF